MKIIKENKPFENWNLQVTCTGGDWNQNGKVPCGSILEIDVNDLLKRKWGKYPYSVGTDYGFNCPVCECFTPVEDNKLSTNLKNMAKDYNEEIEKKKSKSNQTDSLSHQISAIESGHYTDR